MSIRAAIVKEARSWIRTPYIKRGKIKGVGVDCGMLPYMVYREFNLVPDLGESIPTLEDGWFTNTSDQRYARIVERYWRQILVTQCRRDETGNPAYTEGNLVLVKSPGSRVFNHAGIITRWPRIIDSVPGLGVTESDASTSTFWALQQIAVYDIGVQ